MKTTVTVPSVTKEQTIDQIRINPGTLTGIQVIVTDRDRGQVKVPVDISERWVNATDAQRNTIKAFFKLIVADALTTLNGDVSVTSEQIEGDLFE